LKKKLLVIAKLLVSVSLLWYLISIVDFNETLGKLKNVDFRYLALAFTISITMVMLSALKWKLILKSDGLTTPYPVLLQSYYIGNFLGLFLPTGFGGDIYRVYALSSRNKAVGKVTFSVLFDRLTGLYALLSIALLGYLLLPDAIYDLELLLCWIIGITIFFLLTTTKLISRVAMYSPKPAKHIAGLLASFRSYRIDFRHFIKIVAIALLFQLLVVVNNKLYTLALDIDFPFSTLLMIVPLVMLTEVIPISINGAGVRDSAYVFFFVLLGHTKEEGLAIGLLVIAMRYLGGLVGGSVLITSVIQRHLATRTSKS